MFQGEGHIEKTEQFENAKQTKKNKCKEAGDIERKRVIN